MPKARVALIVAVVLVLMGVPFLFWAARPTADLTVHYFGIARTPDGVVVTFDVSNHTDHPYSLMPVRLETRDGPGWKECSHGICGTTRTTDLGRFPNLRLSCMIREFPPGTNVRLVMHSLRGGRGLETFMLRLKWWLSGRNRSFSLNPFNSDTTIYGDPVEIISEFAEP